MPLWESNEIYFVAGLSVLVTLGVFASLAYFVYKRAAANGRREDEEQAALEKVLLRKEAVTTSPPTKPLIVSPSFSSPNKVPARHLRSGSYSPTHYLSPYHSRQPRRNSSPTSNICAIQQPKLPLLQLHHPQLQTQQNCSYPPASHHSQHHLVEELNNGAASATHVSPIGNNGNASESTCFPLTTTNNDNEHHEPEQELRQNNNKVNGSRHNVPGSLAHHNSQYYGTISPRRVVGRHSVAPAESNLVGRTGGAKATAAFLPLKCGSGAVIVPHLKHNSFIKSEYVQLPGKDGVECTDEGENWKCKDDSTVITNEKMNKWKNCSDVDDGSLRRKLLLQKQYQQKLQLQQSHHHRLSTEPPGELFKMKHTVSEEIPYYISTQ